MKLKSGDIIVTVTVLVTALVLLINSFAYDMGDRFYVKCDGNVSEYPLDKDRTVTLQNNGITLVLEVKENSVSVTDADCPDRLCERAHGISRIGETIVCLPARVVIGISEGERSAYEADGIVG